MAKLAELRWDDDFLRARARDAQVEAFQAQTDADWQAATDYSMHVMADSEAAHRDCPVARCRRARRCALSQPPCIAWFNLPPLPQFDAEMVDEEYARLQEARRDAATCD